MSPNEDDDGPQSIERPASVPETAYFNPRQGTWIDGPLDPQGRHHGRVEVYTRAGWRCSELHYLDGRLHGPFRRFHPDGTAARSGTFVQGELDGRVIAYAGGPDSPERLRACCVPPAARKLVAHYERGRCQAEIFYDELDRRLLDDGSLYPEHPPSVPRSARYLQPHRSWEEGRYDGKGRQGRFRHWSLDGHLTEVTDYADDARHGLWERYDEDGLVCAQHFRHGVLDGPHRARVRPGHFTRDDIVSERGQYAAGLPVGEWSLQDSTGELVATLDLGASSPDLDADTPAFSLHATGKRADSASAHAWAEELEGLARTLTADGQFALADIARLRAAGVCRDRLRASHVAEPPVAWSEGATEAWIQQLRQREGATSQRLSELVLGLRRGAQRVRVLRELATLTLDRPKVALAFAELAALLDDDDVHVVAVQALALFELGRVVEARELLCRMERTVPGSASAIEHSARCTFPVFDFWPDHVELDDSVAEQLPTSVGQPLEALRIAVAKVALRLDHLRSELRRLSCDPDDSWFPPDVSSLHRDVPVALEQYQFTVNVDGETDTVLVDERLTPDTSSVPALMRQVRIEWQALCWLCFAAGASRVELPTTQRPQERFGRALSTAFSRHFRCIDQLQTGGLRSKVHQLRGFVWEGLPVERLRRSALELARDDYREMRAVLFFCADASCRSAWQDDLRG